jgi:cytochrome c
MGVWSRLLYLETSRGKRIEGDETASKTERDMFDTMTMTKITGALCGTLLVFLLGNWVAETVYHVGSDGHGDDHAMAYPIEVAEESGDATAEEGPDFAELLAAADAGKGEKVFGKCKACHKLEDGANGTGPHLFSSVGRDIGSVAGFGYSDVLASLDGNWTPEALNGFLENPKGYAPGTKMGFAGLKKVEDRANVIAYLETIGG